MDDSDVRMLTLRAAGGKYFIRVKDNDPWHEITKDVWEMLSPYTTPGYPSEVSNV